LSRCFRGLICLTVVFVIIVAFIPTASAANAKIAALTFDDGPHATHTPMLLDGLKKRGVKATFFILGSMVQNKRDIVLRMHEEGHQIASHAWSHTSLTKLTDEQIRNEISRTADLLTEIVGTADFMLRPPNGAFNSRVLAAANVPTIMWSVDPTNGRYPTAQATLTSRLISAARDGSIILLHDTNASNVNTAFDAIDALRAQGYEFVTLNELFRLKGVTPVNGVRYHSLSNAYINDYDETLLDQHWAASAIEFVKETEIMLGDGTGFLPNMPMSRAVAVTVLRRMAVACGLSPVGGEPLPPDEPNKKPAFVAGFKDVPVGHWYSQAVEWAYSSGVVDGYSNTIFGTDDNITREQFYVMLNRCLIIYGVQLTAVSSSVLYGDDARISAWASASVTKIRKAGFASKNDVEIFRPHDDITRAEAAELIMWFLQNAKNNV
jgi:peptidoglycan/xylan/chitin deacetylase (PgdA/CDA1 family)